MNILAISDRPPEISISTLVTNHTIDIICTLGDLDRSSLAELEYLNQVPKLGVYGNHDTHEYFESLGILNMHLHVFEYNGYSFGGFEGCVKYKNDTFSKMYTQEEAKNLLSNFPKVDVMISHSPPYGINDEIDSPTHQGFVALTEYVETKKPKYLIHGHTYPEVIDDGRRFGETAVYYVNGYRIITIF